MSDPASIVETIRAHADKQGEAPALITGKREISYGQLWSDIQAAASGLMEAGARAGEHVMLSAAAGELGFVAAYFATHLIGAVAVPIDPKTPPAKAQLLAGRVKAACNVAAKPFRQAEKGTLSFDTLLESGVRSGDLSVPAGDAAADVIFTSGTTGTPKGVVLLHRNLTFAAQNINHVLGNTRDDIEVLPLPLSHSFGLGRLRCILLQGGTAVLVPGFSFPGLVTAAIKDHGATGFASVPSGLAILEQVNPDGMAPFARQLSYVEIGSAFMPEEAKRRLMRQLPDTRICMHYGLTEASRSAFLVFHEHVANLGAVGRASPEVEIEVRGQTGEAVPAGSRGQVWIRGAHVMARYYEDVDLTRASLREDGWFLTGDIGHLDTEGFLYLHGRETDLINIGGRKVAPLEIENALTEVPGIQEAACVAEPDDGMVGVTLKALLVADPHHGTPPDKREILSHLRRMLEPYKLPASFVWVERLPRTANGKLQRDRLLSLDRPEKPGRR